MQVHITSDIQTLHIVHEHIVRLPKIPRPHIPDHVKLGVAIGVIIVGHALIVRSKMS